MRSASADHLQLLQKLFGLPFTETIRIKKFSCDAGSIEVLCQHLELKPREFFRLQHVILERFPGDRNYILRDLRNCLAVNADFMLCVGIDPEMKKMEEIVKIDLPVP